MKQKRAKSWRTLNEGEVQQNNQRIVDVSRLFASEFLIFY